MKIKELKHLFNFFNRNAKIKVNNFDITVKFQVDQDGQWTINLVTTDKLTNDKLTNK